MQSTTTECLKHRNGSIKDDVIDTRHFPFAAFLTVMSNLMQLFEHNCYSLLYISTGKWLQPREMSYKLLRFNWNGTT